MKRSNIRIAVLFSSLFFIFSVFVNCSDDPVSPQETDTDKAIASETIGASGGKIETENISIEVPAGALEQSNTISIYEHQDDDIFAENGNSMVMEIQGLPETIKIPLTIKMKTDDTLDENCYLAFGRLSINESILDSSLVYDLYPARDSSGYLIGELPATSKNGLSKLNKTDFGIYDPASWLVKAVIQTHIRTTEHFEIYYPISLSDKVNVLEQELEKVYDLFDQDLGLSLDLNNNRWKIWIKVQQSTILSYFGNDVPLLNISRDKLNKSEFESIRKSLAANFVHFCARQSLPVAIKNDIASHYWLEAAVSAWIQEFLTESTFTQPDELVENAMSPFNGLRAGAGTLPDVEKIHNHGVGLATLIKFLTEHDKAGISSIAQLYANVNDGFNPAGAVHYYASEKLGELWWAEYLQALLEGEIYEMDFNYFLNNAHGIANINTFPVTKTFSSTDASIGPYPDISAKMFKINLSSGEIDPSYRMLLSATGPADNSHLAFIVYALKGSNYEYLGTAYEQDVTIPDLKQYYDEGFTQYLVVVVNNNALTSFLGETNIDFTIDVGPAGGGGGGNGNDLTYNRCIVDAHFYGTYESTRNGPVETYTDYKQFGSIKIEGGFMGNTFSGIHDDGYGTTETVLVTLNDDHTMVTSVSWVKEYKYDDLGLYEILGFTASNIPINPDDENKFEIRGNSACDEFTVYDNWTSDDSYIKMTDHYCDENSLIYISFSEE